MLFQVLNTSGNESFLGNRATFFCSGWGYVASLCCSSEAKACTGYSKLPASTFCLLHIPAFWMCKKNFIPLASFLKQCPLLHSWICAGECMCLFKEGIMAVRVSVFLKVCLQIKNKYSHMAGLGTYCRSLESSFHNLELHFITWCGRYCNMPTTSDEEIDNLFNTFNFILLITHDLTERRESQIFGRAASWY